MNDFSAAVVEKSTFRANHVNFMHIFVEIYLFLLSNK